ncbi:polymorphic toxin-type HINT domain-containing protein [Paludisphaera soli]|uniref:polymorphic toxin-type HINT domain-containing protein n=1 Tax=Paludisphaera soli TaxID=2712865 RepID=UPI0013EA1B3D|nr:polymorphic toxin-type HINT domain-containing protein [Paludisphaera soli]
MIAAWLLGGALCVVAAQDEASRPPEPDLAAYEGAKAAAGRDADAQVRLALWCEAHGMASEKSTHLNRAILLDPDHEKARGLLGYVKRDGKWQRPAEASKAVEESPELQALLREYLDRRARAADGADDQYKLALWCEEKGLTQPMVAHLHRTLQHDPSREGAWRRLGFEKIKGRWVNPQVEAAMKTEREAQAKADRFWKPKLETLRTALAGKNREKRAEAQAALATIEDPRAVPSLWQVFAKGGNESRQRAAVDAFSRIDGSGSSLALATLALFSPHAAIRSDAATLVQRRDPREYAGMLAESIRDEVKYKVKPVDGPGSTGELLVEGEEANVRRLYRPLQNPTMLPGDQLGRDENGNVVLNRPVGAYIGPNMSIESYAAMMSGRPVIGYLPLTDGTMFTDPVTGLPRVRSFGMGSLWSPPDNPAAAVATLERAGVPSALNQTAVGRMVESNAVMTSALGLAATASFSGGFMAPRVAAPVIQESLQFPVEQMRAEAQMSALVAREQLANDVASLEAHNAPIREVNERAVAILKAVSGEDRGDDRKKWMNWVLDLQGYGQPFKGQSAPPAEVVEEVPIAFQAQSVAIPTSSVVGFRFGSSCFAAGTTVRTLRGDRPIEQLQPGDQVLSQDTATGKLDYKPVLQAVHNPPDLVYAINLGKETVHATGIHRFWAAGRGWVMARDLKAGDRLRTVGGTAEVVSVEKQALQPVFNLLLSGGDNYCVGAAGVIAHDNGLVEPVAAPFDGVPATADLLATAKP